MIVLSLGEFLSVARSIPCVPRRLTHNTELLSCAETIPVTFAVRHALWEPVKYGAVRFCGSVERLLNQIIFSL